MNDLPCCKAPSWVAEIDLDHAGGFDFMLGKCERCGTYWMNVFCVASSTTGYEPVNPDDVERMRTFPSGPERKAFMRAWADEHL